MALASVVVLAIAGVVWVTGSFGSKPSARAPGAASTSGDTPQSMLQMAEAAAPGVRATTPAGVTPTSMPTTRRWDTTSTAVISDASLVQRLDQALAGVDGQVSVAVKNLGDGHGAVLDGDQELPAASLYKLPVLFAVFEAGLSMGEQLPITDEARSYDSGTLELGVGETLSVAEALERMVTISDNTAGVMLGSRAGGRRVNADIAALGMDETHYGIERMTTSASDMLHFMDLLAQGKMVSAAASADMLHLLLRQRVNDRLPRLLPDSVAVAHKTGNLPGTVNDVGIMYGPSSTVAIAALVSETSDESAAASAIAQVALAAYTYFEDQPEDAARPTIPRAPTRPVPPVWREPHPVPTATATAAPLDDTSATPAAQTIETTPLPALGSTTPLPAQPAATRPPTAAPASLQASATASASASSSASASPTAKVVATASATAAPPVATATSSPPAPARTPARATPPPTPVAPAKR